MLWFVPAHETCFARSFITQLYNVIEIEKLLKQCLLLLFYFTLFKNLNPSRHTIQAPSHNNLQHNGWSNPINYQDVSRKRTICSCQSKTKIKARHSVPRQRNGKSSLSIQLCCKSLSLLNSTSLIKPCTNSLFIKNDWQLR